MRTQRLGWILLASAASWVGCGTPTGNDAGDTLGTDAQDNANPTDIQGGDTVDVPAVDVPGVDVVSDGPGPDVPMMLVRRTTPTNGSAIAVSPDDMTSVACNRTADSVSIFRLTNTGGVPGATRVGAPISTGANSEPWAAVISNDGDTAYVILRRTQRVVRITGIRGATPTLDAGRMATTGSEPTGIAITPSGTRLMVANWADGTITIVNTADMTVSSTLDLNPSILPFLGASTARRGMAHPRVVAITNSGDTVDTDETAYVTEFFSQHRSGAGVPTDDSAFDQNRVGVVYRIAVGTGVVGAPITIAPIADTGFADSNGAVTGCIPNQLYAATLNGGRLYVTSVCESPRGNTGPVCPAGMTCPPTALDGRNFKTEIHASVFAINTATNTETPAQGVMMNRSFQALYDAAPVVPDDGTRRMPLIPNDIAFAAGTNVAYVSSYGSDAVFRIQYNADGTLNRVGAAGTNFINLTAMGQLPVGIATANGGATQFAYVINENSRSLSLIALGTQSVATTVASADPPAAGAATDVNAGRRFFVTGLGRWSLRGQGWNSCEACHPDGLTDNITWYFGRGPRQTTSLDGSYGPSGERRLYNWTAIFDETHDFELNTRGNSGGVGAVVHRTMMPAAADDRIIFDGVSPTGAQIATATPQAGLNGSVTNILAAAGVPAAAGSPGATVTSSLADWNHVDAYIRTIRAPRGVTGLAAPDVAAGLTLFTNHNCAGCHGGSNWTISRVFYTPGQVVNAAAVLAGNLRGTNYTLPATYNMLLNPPANNAGRAASLRFSDLATAAANDQINCILRAVGTFPAVLDAMQTGVVGMGSPIRVREVRANMTTNAQGATGYNIPSLVGMVTGAPYLHGGNARSLEEMFLDDNFVAHARSHSANFLMNAATRTMEVQQLVAFLLTIDDATTPIARPATVPDLCPMTFP